jgi:hypothetical protein
LNGAAAAIDPAAEIGRSPELARDLVAAERLRIRPQRRPLRRAALGVAKAALGVGGLNPAGANVRYVHRMAVDQIEHAIGGPPCEVDQPTAALLAKSGVQFARVELEAGDHLSAIAARRAPAGLARFQQDGVRALLGQMQRRAQPAITPADDADVGPRRRRERRDWRGGSGGRRPEREPGKGRVHSEETSKNKTRAGRRFGEPNDFALTCEPVERK